MMITHWPYGTQTEVHGLTDKAMHLYIGTADDPLLIVRGGIFGGTLPYLECALKAYMIALHQTLSDGYMGTEECIWAMMCVGGGARGAARRGAARRCAPRMRDAMPRALAGDVHGCGRAASAPSANAASAPRLTHSPSPSPLHVPPPRSFARFPHLFAGHFDNNSLGNHGDNCASFQKNLMEEEEIAAGKRPRFVSAPIPEFPSWWQAAQDNAGPAPAAAQAKPPLRGAGGASAAKVVRNIDTLVRYGAVKRKATTSAAA